MAADKKASFSGAEHMGSEVVPVLLSTEFYPRQFLYWNRAMFDTTRRFDMLIKPMLHKLENRTPIEIDGYDLDKKQSISDAARAAHVNRFTDPSHLIFIASRQRGDAGAISLMVKNYSLVDKELWMKMEWVQELRKMRFDALPENRLRGLLPIGTRLHHS